MTGRSCRPVLFATVLLLVVAGCAGHGTDSAGSVNSHVLPRYGPHLFATSDHDVWLIGASASQAHARHWDGRRWREMVIPFQGHAWLEGATEAAPNDVWVVGGGFDPAGPPQYLHWDGSRWHRYQGPPHSDQLLDEGAIAGMSGSVWSGGATWGRDHVGMRSYLQHWDGHAWSHVDVPEIESGRALKTLAASRDQVWLVLAGGLLLHGDGTSWQRLPTPSTYDVDDLVVSGDDDVTVHQTTAKVDDGVVRHWDGHTWTDITERDAAGQGPRTFATDGKGGWWYSYPGTLEVRADHVEGTIGLVHRSATGQVTSVPVRLPSFATVAKHRPKFRGKALAQPWYDTLEVTVLGEAPGTSTVWVSVGHRLEGNWPTSEEGEGHQPGEFDELIRIG